MREAVRELRRTMLGTRRFVRDVATGMRPRLSLPGDGSAPGGEESLPRITLEQAAGGTAHAGAKRQNIALAAEAVNRVTVEPGRVFSFWRIVGRPSPRRGFVPGRSLVAGRLTLDHGGGLCQLSGALYHLALLGGLSIVERHPHTLDIYTEETRYTPLGADAAVAYGFKDLRIANTFAFPVSFTVELAGERLRCSIVAPRPIAEHHLRFEREERGDGTRSVVLYRSGCGREEWECVGSSLYIVAA